LTLFQYVVLALVQGLTEFLPISSSAHLILLPRLADWPDQGLAFDVAVHVGTLVAVVVYFHRQLLVMARDWALSITRRETTAQARLAWLIIAASVPVAVGGLALHDVVENYLRAPLVIAATTIGFGLLLWWADRASRGLYHEYAVTWKMAVVIGLAQVLALVPGTSRSGITMTAGLMLGMTRQSAARFSFLLAIPVIVMAGGYEGYKLLSATEPVQWTGLAAGVVVSALTAFACIHFFLRLLDRIGFLPFVIYRLALGVVLIALFV